MRKSIIIAALLGVVLIAGLATVMKVNTMNTPAVDWKALEFTCVHESDLLPQPSPEADAWHKEARAYYKTAEKSNNEDLFRRSFELTRKAAEAGHVKAMNNLVVNYLNGDGTAPNEEKAVEWTEKLIKNNIGMGYYNMGVLLQQGIGVRQDRKAALAYFRKAADLGNAQGQAVTGDKIISAAIQTPDRELGFSIGESMLKCALNQKYAEAGYKLGIHYQIIKKNITQAIRSFQAAAQLGHRQSIYSLMTMFEDGEDGAPVDKLRAACYERLWHEIKADKTKTFPDIDRICPLPPKPMPKSSS